MSRPESQLPPNLYYNQQESVKYTNCNRIINIQTQLSERAIQLLDLNLDECSLVLDIGCGSGISGFYLTQEGVNWVGLDISESMLNVAQQEKTEGELLLCDIGQGFKFRPGVFDAAISISVIQWLCVSFKKSENPYRRCTVFFESLRNCLKNNGRGVFQFYPENNEQINMITSAALRAGFSGDIVVDYPNSAKAKKLYLVVQLGGQSSKKTMDVIQGLVEESDDEKVKVIGRQQKKIRKQKKQKNVNEKSKLWIIKRKEKQARLGRKIKKTTKYTGRKRNNLGLFK
ncbi:unnamed protein product (macronuclear) [Paramecium tetraurelia]|uniref:Methyltransferase type 11 domain-containing protein n=1 Tax=Paramecium tetraurelia TaxID=5888 RepID=A0BIX4_PARTE|nr:uncharacterized protein GSPATT00004864001 [Paramecium tetraurelia]CAK58491.1 unnamed protein product [Paramecium tetraurelia]|eukprot:XP_001425889.1 hypothetical protein (macronuclear) [Paramecium tetraurelia strain d4-2]